MASMGTSTSTDSFLLVGSYSPEIHCLRYDDSGVLTPVSTVPVDDPSYVAYDAARGVVHAVVEQQTGRVASAFFTPTGGGRDVGSATQSGGADPCHLVLHPLGAHLFVANYSSGSVAVLPVDADGRVTAAEPTQLISHHGSGPFPGRQEAAHAHMTALSPDGRFVLAVDLGTDSVYSYAYDPEKGPLTLAGTAVLRPGAGPRHLAFHGSGRYLYLLNELASTVTVCAYDPEAGTLFPEQEISCRANPSSETSNWAAAIRVSPDDRFVYAANRIDDTIAVFAISDAGSTLNLLEVVPCGGSWPRDIVLSPDGGLLFSANQKSDSITVFRVDQTGGGLTPIGAPYAITAPTSLLPIDG
jgi:6-phosphogluconolactonase (cycloisomerase 2 family)